MPLPAHIQLTTRTTRHDCNLSVPDPRPTARVNLPVVQRPSGHEPVDARDDAKREKPFERRYSNFFLTWSDG